MVYTSAYPVTVDGVRLDTLAWGVEVKKMTVPGVREASEIVPGRDGVIPALDEDFEPGLYSLDMMVRGANEDGLIPADSVGELRRNLDHLLGIFSTRHRLLDVREVVDGAGAVRQADMKRLDSIVPTVEVGNHARFSVTLSLPGVFWRSPEPLDWIGAPLGGGAHSVQDVTTLEGSTAAVQDAIYLVGGPYTNPTITDETTGWTLRLNAAIPQGQAWRVNTATWSTRLGALTLDSDDSAGADQTAVTEADTPSGRFLDLTPTYDPAAGARRVRVSIIGGGYDTAVTPAPRIRSRKAYL